MADETRNIRKRWCSQCEKYIEPKGKKNNICPYCGSFTAKYAPEDKPEFEKEVQKTKQSEEGSEQGKKKEYTMTSQRLSNLTGREMATAEMLINAGFAKNFNDLVRKGIDLSYRQAHMPFNQQLNQNSEEMQDKDKKQKDTDPEEEMKEIQKRNMLDAYIEQMRKGKQGSPFDSLKDLQQQKLLDSYINGMNSEGKTDPLQFMLMKSMMDNPKENKNENKNDFTDKLMQIQMIKAISGNGNQDSGLQKEIADLKFQMQAQQLQSQQKSNNPINDQLTALERIRSDRDEKVKQAELQAQEARDKMLEFTMNTRMQQLQKEMEETRQQGGGNQRIQELAEQLEAIRKLSGSLGIRDKGAGETFMEGLGNVASQVAPALAEMGKRKQTQTPPPVQTPQPAPQINPNPQPQNPQPNPGPQNPQPEQPNPGPQINLNPGPQHPSSSPELTASEKQLSDTMADMYIKKKENK